MPMLRVPCRDGKIVVDITISFSINQVGLTVIGMPLALEFMESMPMFGSERKMTDFSVLVIY